jgi:uncharacterized protein YceK
MRSIALLAAVAALALTGCGPIITDLTAEQAKVGGPVRIVTTMCLAEDPANGCAPKGPEGDGPVQALAGYLVPEGATAIDVRIAGPVTAPLVPSSSYRAALEAKDPAPAGAKWLGFRTDLVPDVDLTPNAPMKVTARFRAEDGATSFPFDVRMAGRLVGTAEAAKDPFDCAKPPQCVPAVPGAGIITDGRLFLRDAELLAGAPATATAGGRASQPFTLRYTGDLATAGMKLSATTAIPGATATPDPQELDVPIESPGDRPVTVAVDVPRDTPPGDYDVTLKLELPDGPAREASAKIAVAAAPSAPPERPAEPAGPVEPAGSPPPAGPPATIAVPPKPRLGRLALRSRSIRVILRDGLRLRQDVTAAGTLRWSLAKRFALARPVVRKLAAPGPASARIRLSRRGRKALRGRRHATIVLRTTLVDALGRTVTRRARVRLKR